MSTIVFTVSRGALISSMADLRLINGAAGDLALLAGYSDAADYGAGLYRWDPDTITGDDDSTIVVPTVDPRGRWLRVDTSGITPATGTITCVAKASLVDTDYFTIDDGVDTPVIYELDVTGDGVTSGRTRIDVSSATTSTSVATIVAAVITATQTRLVVADNEDGTLSLHHKRCGIVGNVSITENVANAGFLVTGMSGGT